ncbi:MAG: SHOCT domain-containing protein, partial [Rhodoglobus sp.]|nr:SHOCT domain-containing protein [Rhodoglobus sp.]
RAQEIYGIFEGIVRINEAERSGVSSQGATRAATKHEATQTSDEHSQATVDLLRELGELRDSGVITAQEFEAKKKALLDQIGQGPS